MKVALINPPTISAFDADTQQHIVEIAYLASYLEIKGFEITLIDCTLLNYSVNEAIKMVMSDDFCAIGFATYHFNILNVFRMASRIRAGKNNCFMFMWGYEPSINYLRMKEYLHCVNCLIVGEPEITVCEMLNHIRDGRYKEVPGIVFLKDDNIIYTGQGQALLELDTVKIPKKLIYTRDMSVFRSRGCNSNCTFCSTSVFRTMLKGRFYRERSPENVFNEIKDAVEHGAEIIRFCDDSFDIDLVTSQEWVDRFISLVKQSNLTFKFTCFMRINNLLHQKERVQQLVGIGLVHVFVGIESFLDKHLIWYNKRVTADQNIEAISILKSLGITFNIGFMLFNPVVDIDDILQTVRVFKNKKSQLTNMIVEVPISQSTTIIPPYSQLYQFLIDNNLLSSSAIGYRFIDGAANLCYELCCLWREKVMRVYGDRNGAQRTLLQYDVKQSELIRNILLDVFYLDLDFLEEVALAISESSDTSTSAYMYLIDKYSEKLGQFIKELEKIKIA